MKKTKGFSWCTIPWVFNGFKIFMGHEYPLNMEIFIDHEKIDLFSWCFHDIFIIPTHLLLNIFHGVGKIQEAP